MGTCEGFRSSHYYRAPYAARRVPRCIPSPCVIPPLLKKGISLTFGVIADLTQEEIDEIDKAGALGPPSTGLKPLCQTLLRSTLDGAVGGTIAAGLAILLSRFGWISSPCEGEH